MTDSGRKYATSVTRPNLASPTWANPTNAQGAPNGTNATSTLGAGQTNENLVATFGTYVVPAGEAILYIVLGWKGSHGDLGTYAWRNDAGAALFSGDAPIGVAAEVEIRAGRLFTAAQLAAGASSRFTITDQGEGAGANVDAMWIQVFSAPPTQTSSRRRAVRRRTSELQLT